MTAVSIAFKLLIDQIENSLNKKIVLEEKTKAELNYLRAQINPHFLFNTLNNITALIHINPDKAEQSIIKLSKIMRAMLNSGTHQKIELATEIELLNSYVDLQKIRLNEDTQLNYSVTGNLKSLFIEPLILINFIENVFKHGVGEGKNIISVNISVNENLLHLTTENKITSDKKDDTSGIGMVNVKKRLNIVYKDKYRLTISSSNSIYKVNLVLELT
ncbi:MAG: histidine kinase [Bacteroidota bacterium]|nr:histidine kinase [Bacteroidota bacterium]